MTKVTVLAEFRDKDNFARFYKVGEEVTGFDKDRIADMVSRGLVKVEADDAGEGSAKGKADENGKGPAILDLSIANLTAKIATIEDADELNELLVAEKEGKNRSGAVKALEGRMAELS